MPPSADVVTDLPELADRFAHVLPPRHALMHSAHEWHVAVFDTTESVLGPRVGWVTIDSDPSLAALLLRQYDRARAADGRRRPRKPRADPAAAAD